MTDLTATVLGQLGAVQLVITDAPTGPVVITRTDVNGSALVRQYAGAETSAGKLTVTDYEAALNGPVRYQAEATDGTVSPPVTVNQGGQGRPVLSVVGRPSASREFLAVENYDESSESETLTHTIYMRPDPVPVLGRLSTRKGTFALHALTYRKAAQLRDLSRDGDVLHVRQPSIDGLDVYFVASAWRIVPTLIDTLEPEWIASAEFVEVGAPSVALTSGALWTYAELAALVPTYGDVPTSFATYFDVAVGP